MLCLKRQPVKIGKRRYILVVKASQCPPFAMQQGRKSTHKLKQNNYHLLGILINDNFTKYVLLGLIALLISFRGQL